MHSSMSPARHLCLPVAVLLTAALMLSATVPAARAQEENKHEEEFNYTPGDEHGPEHWGQIKKEWATCSTGRMQSPIDLSHQRVSLVRSLGYLSHSYRPAEASIVNRGHDIMVRFKGDAGSLVINGTAYHLKQLHWHSPAEHTVDGRRYDMELHMVHESAENKAAVIAILYEVGHHDAFLHHLEPFIRRIAGVRDREERAGCQGQRLLPLHGLTHHAALHRGGHLDHRQEGSHRIHVPAGASQGSRARPGQREAASGGEQQRHQHLPS